MSETSVPDVERSFVDSAARDLQRQLEELKRKELLDFVDERRRRDRRTLITFPGEPEAPQPRRPRR